MEVETSIANSSTECTRDVCGSSASIVAGSMPQHGAVVVGSGNQQQLAGAPAVSSSDDIAAHAADPKSAVHNTATDRTPERDTSSCCGADGPVGASAGNENMHFRCAKKQKSSSWCTCIWMR